MKFEKGKSGNPRGRPPGKTPGAKIRSAIEKHSDEILKSVISAAIDGDMQACKMLLDRITPPLKPQAMPVIVSASTNALSDQSRAVIDSTLAGNVAPDVGAQLIAAMANQIKIREMDELVCRIEALETISHEQNT